MTCPIANLAMFCTASEQDRMKAGVSMKSDKRDVILTILDSSGRQKKMEIEHVLCTVLYVLYTQHSLSGTAL